MSITRHAARALLRPGIEVWEAHTGVSLTPEEWDHAVSLYIAENALKPPTASMCVEAASYIKAMLRAQRDHHDQLLT